MIGKNKIKTRYFLDTNHGIIPGMIKENLRELAPQNISLSFAQLVHSKPILTKFQDKFPQKDALTSFYMHEPSQLSILTSFPTLA